MSYCVIDTESGSRHESSTLLAVCFLVLNAETFVEEGMLDLKLRPDADEHYVVDAQGMRVNRINLVEHDSHAITCKQAKPIVYEFLKKHGSVKRLVPVGHAIKGDLNRITDHLISFGSWEQFCTYHFIDTSVILQYLRICGKMSYEIDGSVEGIAKYFNIKVNLDELHTAVYDTRLTAEIFHKMVDIGING